MMNKFIIYLAAFLFTISLKAHQSDISTTMLVERDQNTWILQISASLTAFQQEIRTHYADTPYKTPGEFKEMVLDHLRKNLSIVFNENQVLEFKNGTVSLGHETNVVFEVSAIPNMINNVEVKNTAFKDIYKSQSALVILKKGYEKKRFVLNHQNSHTLKIATLNNSFVDFNEPKSNFSVYAILLLIFGSILTFFLVKKGKKELALN